MHREARVVLTAVRTLFYRIRIERVPVAVGRAMWRLKLPSVCRMSDIRTFDEGG